MLTMANNLFLPAGVGIAVFAGSGMTGTMPNNGLVISTNPGSGIRFFFECRSNSSTVGVGEFIGLNGSPIVDETNNFFRFRDTVRGGELSIENAVNSETLLSTNQQGVYTCRMPFEGGEEGEFNIGIYPNGFNSELICLFIKNCRVAVSYRTVSYIKNEMQTNNFLDKATIFLTKQADNLKDMCVGTYVLFLSYLGCTKQQAIIISCTEHHRLSWT